MAEVFKQSKTRIVKKMVEIETEIKEDEFVLTLSRDEIKTLYLVTQKVGGDPDTSPRKHISSIARAIERIDQSIQDDIYGRGPDGYARLSRFLSNSSGISFKNEVDINDD